MPRTFARIARNARRAPHHLQLEIAEALAGLEHQHGGSEVVQVDVEIEFLLEHGPGRLADGQMDVAAGGQQHLEQPHRVGYAACPGNRHHDVTFHESPLPDV